MTGQAPTHAAESLSGTAEPAQILFAVLLGAFILFGTAIVQNDSVHNAAHDMRHSMAFPCH
jgi:cobalt transporter subunit CbtB